MWVWNYWRKNGLYSYFHVWNGANLSIEAFAGESFQVQIYLRWFNRKSSNFFLTLLGPVRKLESKCPLGCVVLRLSQHAMHLFQTILTGLLSRYQNTFRKLNINLACSTQTQRSLFLTSRLCLIRRPSRCRVSVKSQHFTEKKCS